MHHKEDRKIGNVLRERDKKNIFKDCYLVHRSDPVYRTWRVTKTVFEEPRHLKYAVKLAYLVITREAITIT